MSSDTTNKKGLPHYMLEDILYQPHAVSDILKTYLNGTEGAVEAFGNNAHAIFGQIHRLQIITSDKNYTTGLMSRYWIEEIAGIPCQIEKASDYLSRTKVIESNKLCVILSDTGEEISSVNALLAAKDIGYVAILGISNVAQSTVVRESDLALVTCNENSNREVHLCLARNFMAQLSGMFLLSIALGRYHRLNKHHEKFLIQKLEVLPDVIYEVLTLDKKIKNYSTILSENEQAVYLGRDIQFPIALEGASKLHEFTTINAIAHSPEEFHINPYKLLRSLSLNLPVIALAPSYDFFDQWKASFNNFIKLQYEIIVLSDKKFEESNSNNINVLPMPIIDRLFSPMIYTIPMQLLACHVGLEREATFNGY